MVARRSFDQASSRRVDEALTIFELLAEPNFAFDLVRAELRGDHPTVVNRVSDRAYHILDGHGTARVGEETFEITKGDTVKIPKGTSHAISGTLDYLIVTSPPFSPANEEIIQK